MRHPHRLRVLLLAGLGVAVLAGCGSSSKAPAQIPATNSGAGSTTTSSTQPAAKGTLTQAQAGRRFLQIVGPATQALKTFVNTAEAANSTSQLNTAAGPALAATEQVRQPLLGLGRAYPAVQADMTALVRSYGPVLADLKQLAHATNSSVGTIESKLLNDGNNASNADATVRSDLNLPPAPAIG